MRFSLRTKFILMSLLIILSIILRYPVTPHEIGRDSFAIHILANSLSEFGYAKWWIHPASIIGSYPYADSASAVPFLLSGISQSTGMDMETVILLYSMILGIFGIFAAYLMAGAVWNNDLFKFLVTIVFSTSQGILTFTTWTSHTRTLFILLLPLFIYLLLKTRTFKVRVSILTFVILILLLATHHYIYFTIPILISYIGVLTFYKLGKYIRFIKVPENFVNIAIFASFCIMFLIPFFTRSFMELEPRGYRGSRYAFLLTTFLFSYVRYMGVLFFFVVGGFISLLLKRNKKFEELFLLLVLVGLAPFLYAVTYMKWFIISFASLLIGISLTNICKAYTCTLKKRYVASFIVILLLLSVSFTGYYQFLHFLNDPSPNKRYMEERTYTGALWIKDNINKDRNMISNRYISYRVLSISEVPNLAGDFSAVYGFVDPSKLNVTQMYSPFSFKFYYYEPYSLVGPDLDWYTLAILRTDINGYNTYAQRFVSRYNLSYFVENKDASNRFSRSVRRTKDNIYDNGKIRIWRIE